MARRPGIEYSGPFFTADPSKTFRRNVRDLMQTIADEGEAYAKSQTPTKTGATRDRITGRTRSLTGRAWAVTAVVSVNTAGLSRARAISARAAAAGIERRAHPFRRTTSALRRVRGDAIASLLRGLQ